MQVHKTQIHFPVSTHQASVLMLIDGRLDSPRRLGRDCVLAALVAAENEKLRHGQGFAIGEVEAIILDHLLVVALAAGEAGFWMIAPVFTSNPPAICFHNGY